jgi:hypothetical protein
MNPDRRKELLLMKDDEFNEIFDEALEEWADEMRDDYREERIRWLSDNGYGWDSM